MRTRGRPPSASGGVHNNPGIVRPSRSRSKRRWRTPLATTSSPATYTEGAYRSSAVGHLRPGHVFVDPGFAGEPEDALTQDVAHDLRRPPLDGVGPRAQEVRPHVGP